MAILKWIFQPAYLLLIIVLVVLYVNREAIFSEEVAESLEAEVLLEKADELVEQLRDSSAEVIAKVEEESVAAELTETESSFPVEEAGASSEVASPKPELVEEENVVAETTEVAPSLPSEEAVSLSEIAKPESDVVDEESVTVKPTLSEAPVEVMTPSASMEVPAEDAVEPVAVEEGNAGDATVPPVSTETATIEAEVRQEAVPVAEDKPAKKPIEATEAPAEIVENSQATAVSVNTTPLAVWRSARAAVWQGDLDNAVRHYQQLIQLQPNNYDAHGEMGNVLLAQSKAEQAADAYAQAARLIYQTGNREMAHRVAGVVSMLNKEKGLALYNQISR